MAKSFAIVPVPTTSRFILIILDSLLLNAQPDKDQDKRVSLGGGSTEIKDARLAVPLTCMVDYKGFRAMAIAHIEFETSVGPRLGFKDGNYNINKSNEAIH